MANTQNIKKFFLSFEIILDDSKNFSICLNIFINFLI